MVAGDADALGELLTEDFRLTRMSGCRQARADLAGRRAPGRRSTTALRISRSPSTARTTTQP
ncbi:nuclear transport factor 2 family protein [Rhodococcus sp. NPDC127530]|uniref:nuclear transport factor 2 family protein n=1 Tax=unclassified Rhodococcus (in: high G+C Gram-positive bacteria) TaxID=192944 RepID=UPI003640D80E